MLSRPHFGPRIEFWSSRRPRSKPWPRFEATTKTDEHYWTGEYACMIPSPPPCATPAAPDAPRTRISLHSAARHKARRNPPPTFVPRAAPPCRQTMNLDSVVAYCSRTIGCCRATRGYFPFCSSFFRWQMCRVGAAAMSRGGRARRGRPFFSSFCVSECFARV